MQKSKIRAVSILRSCRDGKIFWVHLSQKVIASSCESVFRSISQFGEFAGNDV